MTLSYFSQKFKHRNNFRITVFLRVHLEHLAYRAIDQIIMTLASLFNFFLGRLPTSSGNAILIFLGRLPTTAT